MSCLDSLNPKDRDIIRLAQTMTHQSPGTRQRKFHVTRSCLLMARVQSLSNSCSLRRPTASTQLQRTLITFFIACPSVLVL